ncbi:endonuclease domain-containing protein [Nitrobacteraceae bacterium UC4446_H13]
MPRSVDRRVPRARRLRQNPTDAERKLWQRLRALPGVTHFRRQATIGPYLTDFACHTDRIVIEIDGGQHADSASDATRTAYLEASGYRVLRFWNNDVLVNIDGVLETIIGALHVSPPTPDPSPPQERGEGKCGDAGR